MEMHKMFVPLLICIGIFGFADSQYTSYQRECVGQKTATMMARLGEEINKLSRGQASINDDCPQFREFLQRYLQDVQQCGVPDLTNQMREQSNKILSENGCGNLANSADHRHSLTVACQSLIILLIVKALTALNF